MEWMLVLKAFLSLCFVLGLLLLTLWGIKYLEVHGSKCRLVRTLNQDNRLDVLERRRLDARNTLYLVRCDNAEHLLLIGNSNLIVERNVASVGANGEGDSNV